MSENGTGSNSRAISRRKQDRAKPAQNAAPPKPAPATEKISGRRRARERGEPAVPDQVQPSAKPSAARRRVPPNAALEQGERQGARRLLRTAREDGSRTPADLADKSDQGARARATQTGAAKSAGTSARKAKSGDAKRATSARGNGPANVFDKGYSSGELLGGIDFLDASPFTPELDEIKLYRSKRRQARLDRQGRPDPLVDLTLLTDPNDSVQRGLSVIRQSLRELMTGETARLVDTSEGTELEALEKQLDARKSVLEAAVRNVASQLARVRHRRESERETEKLPGAPGFKAEA